MANDVNDEPGWHGDETGNVAPRAPHRTRRLYDKLLSCFHEACDLRDYEVAEQLLHVAEMLSIRNPQYNGVERRRAAVPLVAAYERLWHLRRDDEAEEAVPANVTLM